MHVEDALAQCSVARETKTAGLLRGVIASAAANARANHGNLRGGGGGGGGGDDNFRVADAVVGRAPTPTRPWYHGKGRTGVRHLYRSHLTVRNERRRRKTFFFPFAERLGAFRSLFSLSLSSFVLTLSFSLTRNLSFFPKNDRQIELEATSKPPLTRYQKPLLEREGKGRPKRVATRRRAEEEVAAEAVA